MQNTVSLINAVRQRVATAVVANLWAVDLEWEGAGLQQGNHKVIPTASRIHTTFLQVLLHHRALGFFCYLLLLLLTLLRWIKCELISNGSEITIQVVLVLRQGYVPEKRRTNRTQNSHLKQCISWVLGDWQPHPLQCMTIPLEDIRTCRVYVYCIYSIYTFIFSIHTFLYNIFIYLFISNAIKM